MSNSNYFFSYRIGNNIYREYDSVNYNTAREQCSWYWRVMHADAFIIYKETVGPVMLRRRGFGTISTRIPYTNR